MTVPAHLSSAEQAEFNHKLAGHPAVVTRSQGDAVVRQSVGAVQVDADGNVQLAKAEYLSKRADDGGPAFEWESVPSEQVFEVRTVSRERGVMKGLMWGALVGFVPATVATYASYQVCPSGATCYPPSVGAELAVSTFVGLIAAAITGGIGAAIGAATGDGSVVIFAPEASHPRSASAAGRP
jgi:hypothetical protein